MPQLNRRSFHCLAGTALLGTSIITPRTWNVATLGTPSETLLRQMESAGNLRRVASTAEADVVILATPQENLPTHLEALLRAGKHVYCETTAGADHRQCQRLAELASLAAGRLSVAMALAGREDPQGRDFVRRIRAGALGTLRSMRAYCHLPLAPPGQTLWAEAVHLLDVANAVMGTPPIEARGHGGSFGPRRTSKEWDCWGVVLRYASGVELVLEATQYGTRPREVGLLCYGERGAAEWREARTGGRGREFMECLQAGEYWNEAALGATSGFTALLAEQACYRGGAMEWGELLAGRQT